MFEGKLIMAKKLVVSVIGKARHGKDTLVSNLMKKCKLPCEHISFAKHLKEQAKLLGWDGKKDVAGRTFLQELSTPVKNYYNQKALSGEEQYKLFKNNSYYSGVALKHVLESENSVFFLSDMRFLYEYELFKNCKDIDLLVVYVLRLNADGTEFDNGLTEEQKKHPSEVDHLLIPRDYSFTMKTLEDSELASEMIAEDIDKWNPTI